MEKEIKIGDLVTLKSGGQKMIVKMYCEKGGKPDKTRVVCAWHDLLGDPKEEVYPSAALSVTS